MFSYHSGLESTHPYSSTWLQWVFDIRPILYYRCYSSDGLAKSAISSFGNPAVWWGGLLAMLCMIHRIAARRDGKALWERCREMAGVLAAEVRLTLQRWIG